MLEGLRREIRVATSRRGQPVWFRLTKWAILIVLAVLFWRERAFWWSLAAASVVAVGVHLLYRRLTRGWTRSWGGWNDLDAGR